MITKETRIIDLTVGEFEELLRNNNTPVIKNQDALLQHMKENREAPLSQEEAALFLGITRQQFINYENEGAVERTSSKGRPYYFQSELIGARDRYKKIMKNKRRGKAA